MTWENLPPLSTYPKARRKEMLRRIGGLLTGRRQRNLLNLEEVQDRLGSYEQSYGGLRPIPVDKIIGSVARSSDFDDDFLPLSDRLEQRWQSLEKRFPNGSFPPISVFKLGDAYFVADGHHRVAIAKQRGYDFLDAEITEVHTPFDVTADTDVIQLVHLGQQRLFLETSGLTSVAPNARFTFRNPASYAELLDNVKVHGWDLLMQLGEYVTREDIASSWYHEVYRPTISLIREAGLDELLDDMTIDDVYLWIADRWRHQFPERGHQTFEDVILGAAEEESGKLRAKAKGAVDRITKKNSAAADGEGAGE
jgi:hypothetical protein